MRTEKTIRARLAELKAGVATAESGGTHIIRSSQAAILEWVLERDQVTNIEDLLQRWDAHTVTNVGTGEQVSSPIYAWSELCLDNDDMRSFLNDPIEFREKVRMMLRRELEQMNAEDSEHG